MKPYPCLNFKLGWIVLALSFLASANGFAQSCPAGTSPVYRFANLNAGVHFYTIYESERDAVINNPGFRYEGIGFCAYKQTDGGGGGGGGGGAPASGVWFGSIIQFYVAAGGTQITSSGSSLRAPNGSPVALILGEVPVTGCAYSAVNLYLTGSTTISQMRFSTGTSSGTRIDGGFSSQTTASGTYDLIESTGSGGTCRGSGSWSATATGRMSAGFPAKSAKTPSRIIDLFDPQTGEYLGVMEAYD